MILQAGYDTVLGRLPTREVMSLLSTLRQTFERNRNIRDDTQLEPEVAYEMLKNRRRRRILQYVAAQNDKPVSVSDLAEYQARHYDEDRTAVSVAAMHNHLPKLSEAGICSYDETREVVELTPRGRAVIEVHQAVIELLS